MTKTKKPAQMTAVPGIVIRMNLEAPKPRVSAFIWGRKVRPVPALPYGRRTG
jgi:hypothetical protein